MNDKEKQITAVIEKVLRDTQNCDMSIETLTDYLVDRIMDKVFPKDSVVLTREEKENLYVPDEVWQMIENTRKETAEKIFSDIINKLKGEAEFCSMAQSVAIASDIEIIKKIAKEHGVEIKE